MFSIGGIRQLGGACGLLYPMTCFGCRLLRAFIAALPAIRRCLTRSFHLSTPRCLTKDRAILTLSRPSRPNPRAYANIVLERSSTVYLWEHMVYLSWAPAIGTTE